MPLASVRSNREAAHHCRGRAVTRPQKITFGEMRSSGARPIPRDRCTRTALVTAPFLFGTSGLTNTGGTGSHPRPYRAHSAPSRRSSISSGFPFSRFHTTIAACSPSPASRRSPSEGRARPVCETC